jgi:hypothetical protein
MKSTSTLLSILAASFGLATPSLLCAKEAPPPAASPVATPGAVVPGVPAEAGPRIQLALLLDTSGSMDGLIDQARQQMWQIVNTFIAAKQDGKTPYVEVALYEYGNDGLDSKSHWIRRIQPLTRDLDEISKQLFALHTNGGSEYCGAVIQRAVEDLKWDPSPDTYKAIFIAGNEPFTQGPVKANASCRAAATKGVVVNTIHCGSEATGVNEGWKDGAVAADGKYMVIDSNKPVVAIAAPQDIEIVKLNEQLNKTYLGYGRSAGEAMEKQVAQDKNAARMAPAAASQRATTKASKNYHNATWDLVDASKDEKFDITKVKEADLPEEMRKMNAEERKAHVAKMSGERDGLQKQILELSKQRDAFVAEKRKEMAKAGEADTLDSAMIKAVRDQAAKKKVEFEK